MRTKRRTSDNLGNIPKNELLYRITRMNTPRDQALAAFLYLTGCRISEVVGKTKKIKDKTDIIIEPLRKENIQIINEDIILVEGVPCLKWRGVVPRRNIPLKISSDRDYIIVFMRYWDQLPAGAPLFKISRARAWQIINRQLGMFTHYLIHQRLTHLVTQKGLTDIHLKQMRGWKDTRPAVIYTHLSWQDLAEKL